MPFMNIKVAGTELTRQQITRLHTRATDLLASILNKKEAVSSVLVEEVPLSAWAVGKLPVQVAAHVDVKVTRGTNTAEEKAEFIALTMDMLKEVLGSDLSPITYVVIDEIQSDSWGYGGQTQQQRAKHTQKSLG